MAPLLRARFHGVRYSRLIPSPSSSRELLKPPLELLKPPESSYILRRWYGESVAVEETCSSTQTVNETSRESRAVLLVEETSTVVGAEKSVKEPPTANGDKQENAAKELSSADKLSSLIMRKLRSKYNFSTAKDNASPSPLDFTSPSVNKFPEGGREVTSSQGNKLPMEGVQPIKEDKWNQVMNSMRAMAAKKKPNLASSGAMPNLAKSREDENQDDFADLDLPQARGEDAVSKFSSKPDGFSRPATNALRNFTPNVKPKEAEMLGVNSKPKFNGSQGLQHRAQEVKPTSFSFLNDTSSSGFDSSSPELDSTLSELRVTNPIKSLQKFPREAKDTSSKLKVDHDFFKSVQNSSHEAKSAPLREVKSSASRELERINVDDKERDLSYATEVTNLLNRNMHPGYTVCVQNLPSQVNLALVKEALSFHGEIVCSFKKANSGQLCDAFIEFKTAEAMESALASQWLSLDSKAFRMVTANAPITTVVRLSRLSPDTTDAEVKSICEKFGSLEHCYFKRRASGIFDAYYKANELSNMSAILNGLNEVTLNQRRLVAIPAPRLLPVLRKEVLKTREGQAWHASQFNETFSKIETELEVLSVLFEDLKSLAAMQDEMSKTA